MANLGGLYLYNIYIFMYMFNHWSLSPFAMPFATPFAKPFASPFAKPFSQKPKAAVCIPHGTSVCDRLCERHRDRLATVITRWPATIRSGWVGFGRFGFDKPPRFAIFNFCFVWKCRKHILVFFGSFSQLIAFFVGAVASG